MAAVQPSPSLPEPDACAVCLTHPDVRAALDSCAHVFCVPCLTRWATIETKCPLCKSRFTESTPVNVSTGEPAGETTRFREKNQGNDGGARGYESEDSAERIFCDYCRLGDDDELLMLCDACDVGAHTYCVGLESVPHGAWYCELCRDVPTGVSRTRSEGRSRRRDEETSRARDILLRVEGGEGAVRARERRMDRERRAARERRRGAIRRRGGGGERGVMRSRAGGGDDERVRQIARVHELREAWSRLQSGQMEFPGWSRGSISREEPRMRVPSAPRGRETGVDEKPKDVVDQAWDVLEKAMSAPSGNTKKRAAGKDDKELISQDFPSTTSKVLKRPGVRIDACVSGWSMTANAWAPQATQAPKRPSPPQPSTSKHVSSTLSNKGMKFAAADLVKTVLRPLYARGELTKESYKDIARLATSEVAASNAVNDPTQVAQIVDRLRRQTNRSSL